MATYSNSAREVEMPDGNVVVLHSEPTGGANTTSNIKKFKYDDNGHVTESTAADAEDLNLSSYSTPTTGTTAIGTSDDVQTAIGKLDHQSHIDQTNILYSLNTGVKNLLPVFEGKYVADTTTFTVSADGNVSVVSVDTSTHGATFGYFNLKAGTYYFTDRQFLNVHGDAEGDVRIKVNGTTVTIASDGKFTLPQDSTVEVVAYTWSPSTGSVYPMICTEDAWNQSHDYMPFARPNYDLTYLEAEDRAALAEAIDNGVKNRLDDVAWMNSALVVVNGNKTVANDEITLHAESNDCYTEFGTHYPVEHRIPVTEGETVVLSWDYASTNTTDRVLLFPNGSASGAVAALSQEKALSYKVSSGVTFVTFRIGVDKANTSATYSHIMCCTIEEWKVSKKYVPKGYGNATTTSDGLMSADDKTKLDGISNKSAASGGTDVSLCTTGEKYNWNRKQNALILGDYSLDLNSLTFTQSASGMYYSNEIDVGDFTQIFSAMAYDFASLKTTDNVNILINTDRKKIVILSNVNSFDVGAALELQIVGI